MNNPFLEMNSVSGTSFKKIVKVQNNVLEELLTVAHMVHGEEGLNNLLKIVFSNFDSSSPNVKKCMKVIEKKNEEIKNSLSSLITHFDEIDHLSKLTKILKKRETPKFEETVDNAKSKNTCPLDFTNYLTARERFTEDKIKGEFLNNNTENDTKELDCKKCLHKEFERDWNIVLLTPEEFSKLPKYVIHRNTIESVNDFLKTVEDVVKRKYVLISSGSEVARRKGEYDRYLDFAKQEKKFAKGFQIPRFFTADDFCRYTKTKLNKTQLDLFTILRLAKRLEFVKIGKDLFYTVNAHYIV